MCLLLFLSYLGSRPLWDPDEGRHASTSKEMVASGDWITPTLNGEPFFDKPAFHNWLVALSLLAFGLTELAARLPSALMGLVCVVATYRLGRRIYGSGAALVGAVVLATSIEFLILSRNVVHDMSLAAFVTIGLWLFFEGAVRGGAERKWFLLGCASFGGAVLAKGPIGVLLPGAVVLLFLIMRRQAGLVKRMSLGRGLLIGLAVAAPWYVAVSLRNPGYLKYFFVDLNLGSFVGSQPHHPEPIYYYLVFLILGFLPWGFFIPGALVDAWRRRTLDEHGGTLFLMVWAGVYLGFFSLATSKLSTYILPLFPPLALLIGRLWHDAATHAAANRLVRWSMVLHLGFPGLLLYGVLLRPRPEIILAEALPAGKNLAVAAVTILVAGTALSAILLWTERSRAAFASIAASFLASTVVLAVFLLPAMNPSHSAKSLALVLDEFLPEDEPLTFHRRIPYSALFYSDRRARLVPTLPDLVEYLASGDEVYCVIKKRVFDSVYLDARVVLEHGDDVLISNRRTGSNNRSLITDHWSPGTGPSGGLGTPTRCRRTAASCGCAAGAPAPTAARW